MSLDRLFQPSAGTGTAAGTLYHAWFETISWLDDGEHFLQVKDGRLYQVDAVSGRCRPFYDPDRLAKGLAALPAIGALVAATQGIGWMAGGLLAVACLTKPQALLVVPAVTLALYRRHAGGWRAAAAPILAAAAFCCK